MEQEKKVLNDMVKEFLNYDNQIAQTEKILKQYRDNLKIAKENREKLKKTIEKFRLDELHHKNIAYENGANKKGLYSILDKVIKTGSRIAINISEKI